MKELVPRSARNWIVVALLAAVVFYPLSFGPACWVYSRTYSPASFWNVILDKVYFPIIWLRQHGSRTVSFMITDYANWGAGQYQIKFYRYEIGVWNSIGFGIF